MRLFLQSKGREPSGICICGVVVPPRRLRDPYPRRRSSRSSPPIEAAKPKGTHCGTGRIAGNPRALVPPCSQACPAAVDAAPAFALAWIDLQQFNNKKPAGPRALGLEAAGLHTSVPASPTPVLTHLIIIHRHSTSSSQPPQPAITMQLSLKALLLAAALAVACADEVSMCVVPE